MVKTVLCYCIVLIAGNFALTLGVLVTILLSVLSPENKSYKVIVAFAAGVVGVGSALYFSFAVFYLFGVPYGKLALLASFLSIVMSILNDYSKQKNLAASSKSMASNELITNTKIYSEITTNTKVYRMISDGELVAAGFLYSFTLVRLL